MKKVASFVFGLILMFTLVPMTFATSNENTTNPPYSLQYLQNIEGATYLDYTKIDDNLSDEGTWVYTEYTIEIYDVTSLLQQSSNSWTKVIDKFRGALQNAGFSEDLYESNENDVSCIYLGEYNEQNSVEGFSVFSYPQEDCVAVIHFYLVPTSIEYAQKRYEVFKRVAQYSEGKFSDVKSNDWFSSGVKTVYELGLMNGVSQTAFNPTGEITIAETITIASRLNCTYLTGSAEFEQTPIWYQSYVDYAIEHNIIKNDQYFNYNAAITRGQFASIMYAALPTNAWTPINSIEVLPDVDSTTEVGKNVLALYNVGVLTGNDKYGTFNENSKIKRSEAAVMLTRMAIPKERKTLSLVSLPIYIEIPASINVLQGDTRTIHVKVGATTANVDTSIAWKSSNPAVASVDASGNVTGKKAGFAEITASTVNGKSGVCAVSVSSQTDVDIKFAKDALSKLKFRLKFPDTLKLYNIWAFSYSSGDNYNILISIYYSAENSLGLQSRGEYQVCYNMDTGEFVFDDTKDHTSSHAVDRVININQVTGK